MAESAPCFVLGLFDTGLAVVRALSRSGLQVFGFDHQVEHFGFRSKHGVHMVSPDPCDTAELVEFLVQRARNFHGRPVLYPTSDAFVMFVSENRDDLAPYFRLALPSRESVSTAINKDAMYSCAAAAGVPIACMYTPRSVDEIGRLAGRLRYPVVVKPRVGHLWRDAYSGDKAIRIDDAVRLVSLFRDVQSAGQAVLIQSLIVGPNTNHYKVCAYFDEHGHALAMMVMRKVRQYPVDFGVGTLMETVVEPELEELGLRLFRALEWRGPGSIEFKRDDLDGKWKLIELNPRLWQQNGLAEATGMNFPIIQYLDLTGCPAAFDTYRAGVKWLDEFRDPRSAWEHRKRGALTATQWAQSLSGVRAYALWAADDPAPFLAASRHHLSSVWRWMSGTRPDPAG